MQDLRGFGEPPAYSQGAVLGAALLSVFGALSNGMLAALDLRLFLWPALLYLGLAAGLLVFGLMLLIRFVEARDALTDPLPRVRLYDRHERGIYLAGLGGALACLLGGLLWLGAVPWGLWHLLPALITLGAALVLERLWREKR